jgi:phosphinothricin acetyltransferase
MSGLVIRPGTDADLPALTDLYNHYVRTSVFTFDIEPYSVAAREPWFAQFALTGRHRILVATDDGVLQGYVCTQQYRVKAAYETSVETSIYLRPGATGQGLGRQLYTALFALVRGEDLHRAYAGITQPNAASVALHERMGFALVARFGEVGRKFGQYRDVYWYERALP